MKGAMWNKMTAGARSLHQGSQRSMSFGVALNIICMWYSSSIDSWNDRKLDRHENRQYLEITIKYEIWTCSEPMEVAAEMLLHYDNPSATLPCSSNRS